MELRKAKLSFRTEYKLRAVFGHPWLLRDLHAPSVFEGEKGGDGRKLEKQCGLKLFCIRKT